MFAGSTIKLRKKKLSNSGKKILKQFLTEKALKSFKNERFFESFIQAIILSVSNLVLGLDTVELIQFVQSWIYC